MRGKKWGRLISLSLAVALLLGSVAHALPVIDGVGEVLSESCEEVGHGAELYESVIWHTDAGREQEYYVEYQPGDTQSFVPMVAYGSKLYGKSDITYVESYLEGEGYEVVGGINADYFSLQTGLPLSMVITEGMLRSSDSTWLSVQRPMPPTSISSEGTPHWAA